MQKDAYMTSVDLKDAYYSVRVDESSENTYGSGGRGNSASLRVYQMAFLVPRDYSLNCPNHL